MKRVFALCLGLFLWMASPSGLMAQAPLNNVMLGHSGGAGSLNILRRITERDKIWEKYGLNVKSVYFNSGTVLIQAMAGGNIVGSESEVPGMVNLAVAGVSDLKIVTVTINRIEHVFVVRKNIAKPEDLKGKRLAVSRIGSASDTITRMVLRSWRIDPTRKRFCCNRATHDPYDRAGGRSCRRRAGQPRECPQNRRFGLLSHSGGSRRLADGLCPLRLCVPGIHIKTQRETLRRLLMAYLEGISVFRTRPKQFTRLPKRKISKTR
jgi:hypothetical protein